MNFSAGWWNKLEEKERPWWSVYADLDLCGGKLITISDDDQDMLEVKYQNGAMIDVGYVELENNDFVYEITATKDDTVESWNAFIIRVEIHEKNLLANNLQNVIYQIQDYTK